MSYEDVLEKLNAVSESWLFLGLLAAADFLLLVVRPVRRFAPCLAFSLGLFFLRKTLLFVPVLGSISGYDRVVFFDPVFYVAYVALLAYIAAIALLIARWSDKAVAMILVLLMAMLVFACLLSPYWFGSLFVTFGLVVFGIAKLLIVNPLLLPLAFLLFPPLLVSVTRTGPLDAHRTAVTFAAIGLILGCGSIVQIGSQAGLFVSRPDSPWRAAVTEVREGWSATSDLFTHTGIDDVCGAWAGGLKNTAASGVNVVERAAPPRFSLEDSAIVTARFDPFTSLQGALTRAAFEWSAARGERILLAAVGFVVVMAAAAVRRRVPRSPAPPSPSAR